LYSAATANALSQLALYLFNNNENWYGKIATVSAHTTQTALAAYTNFQSLSETAKVIRAGQNIWTVNASLSLSTRVSKLGSLATVSAVNSALNVASLAGNIFVNIDASRRLLGKRIWDGNKMIFVKDTASVLSTGTFFGGIVYAGSLAIGSPVSMPVYLGTTLTFAAIHAGERLWSRNNYGNTDELFHNAHVCLRENKGKEALELAVECAHKVPHKKDYQSFYLNLLANDKLNSGEFASARNICDNALQLNVDVDQFLMLRAQSEVGLGKISEAISDFRKVDELNLPGEKSATTRGAAQQYLAEIAVELNPREIPYPIVNYAAGAVNAAEEDLHAAERARDNYSQAILSPYVDMVANNRFLGPICEAGNFYPNAYLRYRDDRERMATLDDMRKQYAMRYRLLECAVQLNALWRREVNNYNRWNYFFCSHQVPDFEHDKMVKRLAYSGTDPLYEARYNLNLAEKIECRPFLQVAKHLRECFAQTDDELGMSKMIHQKMGCLEQRLRVCDQQLTQSTTKALCLSGGDIPEFAHNRIVSELVHHSQIEDPVAAIEACQSLVTSCRGSFFSMSLRRPWHLSLAVGSALRDGLSSFGLFRNRTSADSTVASDCKSDNGQLLSL
jgi:hypothetical protein